MESLLGPETWNAIVQAVSEWSAAALAWVTGALLSFGALFQLAVLIACVAGGHFAARWVRHGIHLLFVRFEAYRRVKRFFDPLYRPVLILFLILAARLVLVGLAWPVYFLVIVGNLLAAWLVIRLAANFIRNRDISRAVAGLAWTVAALNIVGLLDPLVQVLDQASVTFGETSISALSVITGALAFVLLIWGALALSRIVEGRLEKVPAITPSARVLVGKVIKIGLVTIAFLLALNATGIDLTALAVFGGALGVGLGFGLQKVVSNFVSGIILLLDRSIKPGDVIETQGTYGWINQLGARYTSIITRDGTEFLIPNEDMITQPVVNWSFSSTRVRRKIPLQIDYDCDPRLAMELMVEAASETPRILAHPAPAARLLGFGSDGIDLELRIWIEDPQHGVINVASAVLLNIWEKFHDKGIVFPFPQRVVHFANAPGEVAAKTPADPTAGEGPDIVET